MKTAECAQVTFAHQAHDLKYVQSMLDLAFTLVGRPIYNAETEQWGAVLEAFKQNGCVYVRRRYK